MSVLIKDMEIPENCRECPVALSGKYCRINKTHTTYIKLPIRPEWCPLVEVLKPHGRLIDADTLIAEYDYVHIGAPGVARKLMENAPTVIESEGE